MSELAGQTGHYADGILYFVGLVIGQLLEFLHNGTYISLIM